MPAGPKLQNASKRKNEIDSAVAEAVTTTPTLPPIQVDWRFWQATTWLGLTGITDVFNSAKQLLVQIEEDLEACLNDQENALDYLSEFRRQLMGALSTLTRISEIAIEKGLSIPKAGLGNDVTADGLEIVIRIEGEKK